MSLICQVIGARPNFMKMAPVILEARRRALRQTVVHTGQHYDFQMSGIFLMDSSCRSLISILELDLVLTQSKRRVSC